MTASLQVPRGVTGISLTTESWTTLTQFFKSTKYPKLLIRQFVDIKGKKSLNSILDFSKFVDENATANKSTFGQMITLYQSSWMSVLQAITTRVIAVSDTEVLKKTYRLSFYISSLDMLRACIFMYYTHAVKSIRDDLDLPSTAASVLLTHHNRTHTAYGKIWITCLFGQVISYYISHAYDTVLHLYDGLWEWSAGSIKCDMII